MDRKCEICGKDRNFSSNLSFQSYYIEPNIDHTKGYQNWLPDKNIRFFIIVPVIARTLNVGTKTKRHFTRPWFVYLMLCLWMCLSPFQKMPRMIYFTDDPCKNTSVIPKSQICSLSAEKPISLPLRCISTMTYLHLSSIDFTSIRLFHRPPFTSRPRRINRPGGYS